MKKTVVLISTLLILIGCNKKNKVQNANYSLDTITVEQNTNLVEDKEGITDYVIVNQIPKNCESYYLSILNSSKSFVKDTQGLDESIKQNGGIGLTIKIENSEKNIKYIISETYLDKSTVISTYIYNTTNQKLFLEDYLFGTLQEIDFDQKLLNKNDLNCDQINK